MSILFNEMDKRYVKPGTPGAKRGKRGGWYVEEPSGKQPAGKKTSPKPSGKPSDYEYEDLRDEYEAYLHWRENPKEPGKKTSEPKPSEKPSLPRGFTLDSVKIRWGEDVMDSYSDYKDSGMRHTKALTKAIYDVNGYNETNKI